MNTEEDPKPHQKTGRYLSDNNWFTLFEQYLVSKTYIEYFGEQGEEYERHLKLYNQLHSLLYFGEIGRNREIE